LRERERERERKREGGTMALVRIGRVVGYGKD
jgi:hypothetical protein